MDADQIVKLAPDTIQALLDHRANLAKKYAQCDKRKDDRWPFPGTVEIWLPETCFGDRHLLATLHNLSQSGLAMRTRSPIASDTRVELAIHLPQMSCYGQAIVRHCTRAAVGYLIGGEFHFEASEFES